MRRGIDANKANLIGDFHSNNANASKQIELVNFSRQFSAFFNSFFFIVQYNSSDFNWTDSSQNLVARERRNLRFVISLGFYGSHEVNVIAFDKLVN